MTSEIIASFKIIMKKETKHSTISNLLLWNDRKTPSVGITFHNHSLMVAIYLFSFK